MRNWNRKCGNYGQLGHFDSSCGQVKFDHFDGASGQHSFNSTGHLKSLIQGHAQWIQRFLDRGWDGYLFTVNFNDLPGKRDTKIIQMHREVTRLYGRLATRMIRKTRSPKWARWYCRLEFLFLICRCLNLVRVKKAQLPMYQ